jgi:diguanylate cyclase (GGDEF)-like protein
LYTARADPPTTQKFRTLGEGFHAPDFAWLQNASKHYRHAKHPLPLPPPPALTSGALFVSLGLFALLTALFALSAARGMPAYRRTLRLWAAAMLGIVVTAAGFLARPLLPAPLAYAVPNTAIFGAVALLGMAFAALEGGHPRRARWNWAIVLLAAVTLVGAHVLHAPYGVLVSISSLGLGVLLLHCALLFLPQVRRRPRAVPELWVLAALVIAAATFLLRALPGGATVWGQAMLIVSLVFVTSGSVAFFSMLHERQRLALQRSYQRDSLSGLYTRGVFFEKAQAALEQAAVGDPFAVFMVDLDHFKRINDTYGHIVGDKVIAHAARLLHGTTRLNDLAGRYGGEEFCLLLRQCDTERARSFAQRVLRSAEQPVSLRDGRSVQFSFSIGYVVFQRTESTPALERLLDRADQALLRAKAEGRSQAVEADNTSTWLGVFR